MVRIMLTIMAFLAVSNEKVSHIIELVKGQKKEMVKAPQNLKARTLVNSKGKSGYILFQML